MKFSPRQHFLERWYNRRCSSAVKLGKSTDQELQPRGQFNSLAPERLAKPLPDLIADRAAVDVIDPYICGVLFRHNKIQQDPTLIQ
jgi:hypothetical protein